MNFKPPVHQALPHIYPRGNPEHLLTMLAELSGGEADPKIFIAQVHTVRKYLQRMPNEPLHVIHLQVHNDLPQECECN